MISPQPTPSLVAIVTALSAGSSSGQQTQAPSGSIKRTADGTPSLAGVWQSGGVSLTGEPGSRPPLPPPAILPPPREPISYQAWAAEKNKQLNATDDPIAHCLLPGVPRIITMPMPLEIVQTPTRVVILYEAFRAYRIIPINDQLKHPDDLVPTWMGDSVGRWEGDSLIVDVIGFTDKTCERRALDSQRGPPCRGALSPRARWNHRVSSHGRRSEGAHEAVDHRRDSENPAQHTRRGVRVHREQSGHRTHARADWEGPVGLEGLEGSARGHAGVRGWESRATQERQCR